jgi:tetratricopeptide (TPR) repeat protein
MPTDLSLPLKTDRVISINSMGNKNKHLCPCGSGKRVKLCCQGIARTAKLSLTTSKKLEMRRKVEELDRAGQHLEACEILGQLLAASPRNPLIWNDLAIQYEASGQADKALDALRRGYLCDPTYPPILYNLGKFTLDRFIRLHNAGDLNRAEGQNLLEKAAKFLNANLDRDPDNADAHYNLALVYALGQDEGRAHLHMTVALRINQALEPPPDWELGGTGLFITNNRKIGNSDE